MTMMFEVDDLTHASPATISTLLNLLKNYFKL